MASRAAQAAWFVGRWVLKIARVGAMMLLLFPLLPVGWDLIFIWRRSKRPPEKAILTRLDRLVLRTLAINGVFLALMIWQAKASAVRALAVRGDWMLDGHDGPTASWIRDQLLGF